MLSFKQAGILFSVGYHDYLGSHKDGRSVHALRTRGYITKVEWRQELLAYTFKLTAKGKNLSRQLNFISKETLKELLG